MDKHTNIESHQEIRYEHLWYDIYRPWTKKILKSMNQMGLVYSPKMYTHETSMLFMYVVIDKTKDYFYVFNPVHIEKTNHVNIRLSQYLPKTEVITKGLLCGVYRDVFSDLVFRDELFVHPISQMGMITSHGKECKWGPKQGLWCTHCRGLFSQYVENLMECMISNFDVNYRMPWNLYRYKDEKLRKSM